MIKKYEERPSLSWSYAWLDNGTIICNEKNDQVIEDICSDGNGGALFVWEYNGDIYAQRIDANGNILWKPNGTIVCNATITQDIPRICSDGKGGAFITWYDNRDGPENDIYAQHLNLTGSVLLGNGAIWNGKKDLNGTLICNADSAQTEQQICSDGEGGAIIVWKDERSKYDTNDNIFAQKINSSGDIMWTPNGTEICIENGEQSKPVICSDGKGGAVIAWWDKRNPITSPDIYAQIIRSNGGFEYIFNGIAICTADDSQSNIKICSDGEGGAIIAWTDKRDYVITKFDIYAQNLNSEGGVDWITNGVPICTAKEAQSLQDICNDGGVGAIIAWMDARNGIILGDDIYIQKIDSNGDIKWTPNGTEICTKDNMQEDPRICSDCQGGAIITWDDPRTGASIKDIYAQRIKSSGKTAWTPNGTVICSADQIQSSPKICSDNAGGAIISWNDNRMTNYDIYAQRIRDPIPIIVLPIADDNDDDDDDDKTPAIPFGSYYILFIVIGIIALIILKKRKLIFSKN